MTQETKDNAIRVITACMSVGAPFKNSKIYAAQGMFESARFTSNVYRENNNAFGMKMPVKRKSPYIAAPGTDAPQSEGLGKYARYASLEDSAKDLVHRNANFKEDFSKTNEVAKYTLWLKGNAYYGATVNAYTNGVLAMYNDLSEITEDQITKKKDVLAVVRNFLTRNKWIRNMLFLLTIATVGFYFWKRYKFKKYRR